MSERLRYPELAPEGLAHLHDLEHYLNATTALPAVLLELVRLRVSLRNGCEFCIGHHTGELRKHNEPVSRIEAVGAAVVGQFQHAPVADDAFTPRERAALAWADALTDIQSSHASDEEYAAVSRFFEGKDLVDLTLAISSINAWNRMSIAFAVPWRPHGKKANESNRVEMQQPSARSQSGSPENTRQDPSPTGEHPADEVRDAVDDDGGKVARD